jgi:RNA polymerase sigma-70 factor (ECF subfamily)
MVDEDLLAGLRRNDRAAWADFYDSLAGEIRGYVSHIGASSPDDVLGEVMVQVVRDLPRFTGTAAELRPWVFRIARNRVIDSGRQRSRRPEEVSLDEHAEYMPHQVDREPDPDELSGLLEGLTDDQREVLWLRHGLDLSVADTARIMDREPAAVAALTMRAMNRLRRLLTDDWV